MKKILFAFLMIFIFISFANAQKCTLVKGNGNTIGSEVNCGGEHFYVLKNDGTNVRLLSKYNLYIGKIYYKITVSEERYNELIATYKHCGSNGCSIGNNIMSEPEFKNIKNDASFGEDKVKYNDEDHSFIVFEFLDITETKQSEKAIGAHGDEAGKPAFPEVAVIGNSIPYENVETYAGGYRDTSLVKTEMRTYTNDYAEYLEAHGFNLKDIDVPTAKELDSVVYSITNKHLPLEEWRNNVTEVHDGYHPMKYLIGSLKDELPKGYEWLWSTTYWTRTKFDSNYALFIDTLGNVCSTWQCGGVVGAGVRPIITLAASDIDYLIETKTDGHGTVKSEKVKAAGGEVIKFTVVPEEGYVLGEVKVTDALGNVIIFKDYTFTMPNANVLIEATFVKVENAKAEQKENPKTADIAIITTAIIFITSVFIIYYSKSKLEN